MGFWRAISCKQSLQLLCKVIPFSYLLEIYTYNDNKCTTTTDVFVNLTIQPSRLFIHTTSYTKQCWIWIKQPHVLVQFY